MPPHVEVAHLVRAAGAGDQQSWDKLVSQFAPLVWAVARGHGLATAVAEDVAQTTWLRLVESLATVPADRLGCWLAAGTRVEALNALRWTDPRLDLASPRAERQPLVDALQALPARSRLALRLLAVPDITMPELGAGLGLEVADAEVLIAKSLNRLVEVLDNPLVTEEPDDR